MTDPAKPRRALCPRCGWICCDHLAAEVAAARANLGQAVEDLGAEQAATHQLDAERLQLREELRVLRDHAQALQLRWDLAEDRARRLEAAALLMLQASELGVSEAEGMRRARALADLIGYDPGEQPPPRGLPEDFDELGLEAARLAGLVAKEVEVPGTGWAFALFLYREPREGEQAGHVLQISRDRERTLLAVARWLKDMVDLKKTKQQEVARG
jgi:hypothetical protein